MKITVLLGCLCFASALHAQSFDSTGANRLWAPNPPVVQTPEVVTVPGYGTYTKGQIVKTYSWGFSNNGYAGRVEKGLCLVEPGYPEWSERDLTIFNSKIVMKCPANTKKFILEIDVINTSDGGG